MNYRTSRNNFTAFKDNIFKAFTDAVGGNLYQFAVTVYERFTVDDFAYHDDMYYFGVQEYFQKTVIPHKIEVYKAGVELSKQKWFADWYISQEQFLDNLWIHDISKFSANEAFGYAVYNFKNPSESSKKGFELAWHHHKMHNEHHPEYWMNPNRSGELEIQPMPRIFIAEMIADWIGAGITYGNSLEKWLPDNIHKFKFHWETGRDVTWLLNQMKLPLRIVDGRDGRVWVENIPVIL